MSGIRDICQVYSIYTHWEWKSLCCKFHFIISVFMINVFYCILFSMPWLLQMLMRSCLRTIRRSTSGETSKDQVTYRDMLMLYVIFVQYCYMYIYTLSTLKWSFCNTGKCVSDFLIYIIFDNKSFSCLHQIRTAIG